MPDDEPPSNYFNKSGHNNGKKEYCCMKPGDVAFYRTYYSFSASVIREFQENLYGKYWWTQCNHVAPCIAPPNIIKDAVIPRVVMRPSSDVANRQIIAIARPNFVNSHNETTMNIFLNAQMREFKELGGGAYSWWEVLGMAIYGVSSLLGHRPNKNPIRGGTDCVELSYNYKLDLEKAMGISDPSNAMITDASSIWPAELLRLYGNSKYYKLYNFISN